MSEALKTHSALYKKHRRNVYFKTGIEPFNVWSNKTCLSEWFISQRLLEANENMSHLNKRLHIFKDWNNQRIPVTCFVTLIKQEVQVHSYSTLWLSSDVKIEKIGYENPSTHWSAYFHTFNQLLAPLLSPTRRSLSRSYPLKITTARIPAPAFILLESNFFWGPHTRKD